MRIATFNVESLDLPPKADVPIEARIPVLRPQLVRLRADILCLQEINGQHRAGAAHRTLDALDLLLEGTMYAGYHRAATSGPHGEPVADVHNLVILSRWPLVNVRQIRHELVPPLSYRMLTAQPDSRAPVELMFERPVLAAEIMVEGGQTLTVVNVHLRAPLATAIPGQKEAPFVWRTTSGWAEGFVLSAWKRSAQALEVRLFIDRILDADPAASVIVTGDFNAEDHETPLKILVGADEDTGNGRLSARSLVVLDRGAPSDRRFSTIHHGRRQMLDHVLVSRALLATFRSLEIHNETLGDEAVGYGKGRELTASYHAPVVAEFSR